MSTAKRKSPFFSAFTIVFPYEAVPKLQFLEQPP
jgi:hypothetical protein